MDIKVYGSVNETTVKAPLLRKVSSSSIIAKHHPDVVRSSYLTTKALTKPTSSRPRETWHPKSNSKIPAADKEQKAFRVEPKEKERMKRQRDEDDLLTELQAPSQKKSKSNKLVTLPGIVTTDDVPKHNSNSYSTNLPSQVSKLPKHQ